MANPLTTGGDFVGYEDFCHTLANRMKNHWRRSDPRGYFTGLQPGMIVSDSDDEKLYHITNISPFSDQILQESYSEDAEPIFAELLLDQLTQDDEILEFRSTGDVAHGITTLINTASFAAFKKASVTEGGIFLGGYTEGSLGMKFYGAVTTETSTRSTAGVGMIHIEGFTKSGTDVIDPTLDKNLLAIRSGSKTRAILTTSGELYLDQGVVQSGWDDYDDIALAHDLSRILVGQWDEFLKYNIDDLHDLGLIEYTPSEKSEDGYPSIFMPVQAGLRFAYCAFAQLYHRLKEQDQKILELQNKLKALPA